MSFFEFLSPAKQIIKLAAHFERKLWGKTKINFAQTMLSIYKIDILIETQTQLPADHLRRRAARQMQNAPQQQRQQSRGQLFGLIESGESSALSTD